jgi:hypothetical protein
MIHGAAVTDAVVRSAQGHAVVQVESAVGAVAV